MPLFGSSANDNKLEKHNHNRATELGGTGYGAGTGVGRTHEAYPATGAGMGAGMGEPGMGEPGMNPATIGGRHHVPAGTHAGLHNDGMMGDQYGAGTGAGTGAGGAIPPANAINSTNQPHSGGGAMTGKIEHAVGSLVGSKSLKAKGIQKEQEARAMKVQSQELAEAEKLEHEAGLRRERAVAHGAHPDNRHVGGMGPGGAGGLGGAGAGDVGGPGVYN
ncbi:hypothetical protein MVEN_00745200 [Mycena venus]|uniref:Uncharacterized protein n=1 Tax=Mycena venus TaxID=2733690 RepID=A0A8H6YJD6_9AGAR|nr:hypothetical protein MVEN_00745200 [Mycena venus]